MSSRPTAMNRISAELLAGFDHQVHLCQRIRIVSAVVLINEKKEYPWIR